METMNDILPAAARHGDHPARLIKPPFRTRIRTYRELADLVQRTRALATIAPAQTAEGARSLLRGADRGG
ncbi:MAG: hypothetical protein ACRDF0_09565 [Candidatus Limnocylindria bacterium]